MQTSNRTLLRPARPGGRTLSAALDLRDAPPAIRDRFWSKVDIRTDEECWPWMAYRKPSGYGQFTLRKGVFLTASRVSLAFNSAIPAGHVARHTCDNPPCVNPRHLLVGTQCDNTLDSVARGRANRQHGELHRDARLTAEAVRAIRMESGTSCAALARKYGVSGTAIRRVLDHVTWKEVKP